MPERFRPLLEATAELAGRFTDAGHTLYLVGGSVRDALVEAPGGAPRPRDEDYDIDLTTDARPDQIEALIEGWAEARWTQGKRFGTIGARHAGRRFEITTHRAEAYRPDSRKPDVSFGDDIEVDLARRDFTVNAMALTLPGLILVDPFDGLGDLAARPAADPPRARRVLRRRPAADAARRPLRRRLRPRRRIPSWSRPCGAAIVGSRSSRPSGSATSWTS